LFTNHIEVPAVTPGSDPGIAAFHDRGGDLAAWMMKLRDAMRVTRSRE
jgi:hypothetical protein